MLLRIRPSSFRAINVATLTTVHSVYRFTEDSSCNYFESEFLGDISINHNKRN